MEIRELTSKEDFIKAFPVLNELRPHLGQNDFQQLLEGMRNDGYRMLSCVEQQKIKAVAGFAIKVNFYHGKHIYLYDLVTSSSERSKGYGEALIKALESVGKNEGCENITLSSGLQRKDAHRFYEDKEGFEKTSYVFVKKI